MKKKIALPQQNIRVNVEFYDAEHERKLLRYPTSKQIRAVVGKHVIIPLTEFLTYYLFYRKRPGMPGYRDHREISYQTGKALSDLEDFIYFNGISISTPMAVGEQDIHITERIGESIGLSVINRIHNLTAADWDRIERRVGHKVFDYEIASDGATIIQVETKGSSTDSNDVKPPSVSNHKANIIDKKKTITDFDKKDKYPFPADLRYGTITVLDKRPSSTVKCLLLDPEPAETNIPPNRLRLINRMQFLRDWISLISPRSQMASALSTRVSDLTALSNPFELDNHPLLKATGEPFDLVETPDKRDLTLSFLVNKSRVTDGPSSGIVVKISQNDFFYLGIQDEIAIMASKQNFTDIMKYQNEPGIVSKRVRCILRSSVFERLILPEWFKKKVEKKDNHVFFQLDGRLNYSPEGLVYGILPIKS